MTALALQPRPHRDVASQAAPAPVVTLPALMGTTLPAPIRTLGALALLLLAVAVTGVVLVAVAVAMPVLLVAALLLGGQKRGARSGWREAAPA